MKKGGKVAVVILAVVTAIASVGAGILGVFANSKDEVARNKRDEYKYRNESEKKQDKPQDEPQDKPRPDDIMCYYGCPNSKRVKKLNLRKKIMR